jgi:hypothetical protein
MTEEMKEKKTNESSAGGRRKQSHGGEEIAHLIKALHFSTPFDFPSLPSPLVGSGWSQYNPLFFTFIYSAEPKVAHIW